MLLARLGPVCAGGAGGGCLASQGLQRLDRLSLVPSIRLFGAYGLPRPGCAGGEGGRFRRCEGTSEQRHHDCGDWHVQMDGTRGQDTSFPPSLGEPLTAETTTSQLVKNTTCQLVAFLPIDCRLLTVVATIKSRLRRSLSLVVRASSAGGSCHQWAKSLSLVASSEPLHVVGAHGGVQVIEHRAYDHKADVFSYGITLWELLTGKVREAAPSSVSKTVALWHIVARNKKHSLSH